MDFNTTMFLIGAFVIIIVIISIKIAIDKPTSKTPKYSGRIYQEERKIDRPQYKRKPLLTKNEYRFYRSLKTVIEPLNLQILAKIRLADLVEPVNTGNRSEWYSQFGRVKAKHIDFAICDDMKVLVLIELDDSTHSRADRQERDEFVNTILMQTGYSIVRTYGSLEPVKAALADRGYITEDESTHFDDTVSDNIDVTIQ